MTTADIQEMEKVRQHLQSMLKASRSFTESDDSDQIQSTTGIVCSTLNRM